MEMKNGILNRLKMCPHRKFINCRGERRHGGETCTNDRKSAPSDGPWAVHAPMHRFRWNRHHPCHVLVQKCITGVWLGGNTKLQLRDTLQDDWSTVLKNGQGYERPRNTEKYSKLREERGLVYLSTGDGETQCERKTSLPPIYKYLHSLVRSVRRVLAITDQEWLVISYSCS